LILFAEFLKHCARMSLPQIVAIHEMLY
jgi:hypothetical protein